MLRSTSLPLEEIDSILLNLNIQLITFQAALPRVATHALRTKQLELLIISACLMTAAISFITRKSIEGKIHRILDKGFSSETEDEIYLASLKEHAFIFTLKMAAVILTNMWISTSEQQVPKDFWSPLIKPMRNFIRKLTENISLQESLAINDNLAHVKEALLALDNQTSIPESIQSARLLRHEMLLLQDSIRYAHTHMGLFARRGDVAPTSNPTLERAPRL